LLILCEGVDGGGKSTYVDTLVKTFRLAHDGETNPPQVTVIHKGQPEPGVDAFTEYELPLDEPTLHAMIRSPRHLVVMDRWHAGELVYGQLYRGHSRLSEGGMLHVELTLTALGALKLLVQPRVAQVIKQRLLDRGEDFLELDHVHQVHAWYETHGQTYLYHRAGAIPPGTALRAAASMSLDVDTVGIRHLPGYVGSAAPATLLVGDQRNDGPRARPEFPRAFTPWDNAGSAIYLMNALLTANMRRGVGIVNANEPGVDLTTLGQLPYEVHVVALGNHASATLTRAGVRHEKVPHPQWWRRFKHSQVAAYGEAIKEAAGWK